MSERIAYCGNPFFELAEENGGDGNSNLLRIINPAPDRKIFTMKALRATAKPAFEDRPPRNVLNVSEIHAEKLGRLFPNYMLQIGSAEIFDATKKYKNIFNPVQDLALIRRRRLRPLGNLCKSQPHECLVR